MAITKVSSALIGANTIATGNIADNAVDGTKIAQNSILTRHIDDGQVTTDQLGADAVTGAKIADDAIDSEHYTDGSIDTAHLADNQITLAKMAGGTDGNIISYDASGDPVAIATGSDGQVLTSAGAGQPPAFEAASGGGKVLQVIYASHDTYVASSSTTYADTGLTANITPATNSKVLVLVNQNCSTAVYASAAVYVRLKLFRASTELEYYPSAQWHYTPAFATTAGSGNFGGTTGFSYLDSSPGGNGSTALTYKTQFAADDGGVGDTVYCQQGDGLSSITLIEIGA
jgi:hypothetical protein